MTGRRAVGRGSGTVLGTGERLGHGRLPPAVRRQQVELRWWWSGQGRDSERLGPESCFVTTLRRGAVGAV